MAVHSNATFLARTAPPLAPALRDFQAMHDGEVLQCNGKCLNAAGCSNAWGCFNTMGIAPVQWEMPRCHGKYSNALGNAPMHWGYEQSLEIMATFIIVPRPYCKCCVYELFCLPNPQ
eukprot:1157203-Pelagomonas_calceolata.AAC.9